MIILPLRKGRAKPITLKESMMCQDYMSVTPCLLRTCVREASGGGWCCPVDGGRPRELCGGGRHTELERGVEDAAHKHGPCGQVECMLGFD
jgi:hypothetical protein